MSDEERFIALRATLESCQRELEALAKAPPEPQLETPEAPRPADAGEPRWEKPERIFHQKVLDDLMKGIQEHGQVLTTERNAVENLDRLFKQMNEALEMKMAVDRALRPYSVEGESLEATLERIVKEKAVGSPLDPVLNACIDVDRHLNRAMDRLRDFDIERAEDKLTSVRQAFETVDSDLDDLWASFKLIDTLPGAIESLEQTISDLKGRADSSSVTTDVKIEKTAEEWGLDLQRFGNVQSVISALETLNGDASLIAERILMAMLKSGGGFSKPAVQKLYESASKDFMEVLINRYGECFLSGFKLEDRMQSFVVQYFGYRML